MFKDTSNKKKRGTGIIKLGSLFDKYKKTLRAPEGSVKHAFVAIVSDMFPGVSIDEKDCSYTPASRTLILRVRGALKTEILLRKSHILKEMEDALGEKSSPKTII